MASATPPAAAVQGPLRTTVRPAQHLAPNSIKAAALKNAPLGLTTQLKLWNAKVSSLVVSLESSWAEKKVQMILKYGRGIVSQSVCVTKCAFFSVFLFASQSKSANV